MSGARSCARTIAVLGGGPGGLFFANLLKRADPGVDVRVLERNPPDATYGFGVVFSEGTLDSLREADARTYDAMLAAGVAWDDIEVRRDGERLRCGGNGFAAIARRALLTLLQEEARRLGVELRFETEVDDVEALMAEHDLVLGADGVNSLARARFEERFAPSTLVGEAKFIWFATTQRFDALTFAFERDEHGWFGVHAYPFEDGTSTFIVETDEDTWRAAGLDDVPAELPPGASDMQAMAYCERVFAPHLDGQPLLGNNSRWLNFPTLRARRWHHENLVLLGDAAHTAHFSVGSGTRMAMEDAVALARALTSGAPLGEALEAYEAERRPATARIQRASAPSIGWWERFGRLGALPADQFAFNFLTRTGRITRAKLAARGARFPQEASARFVARARAAAGGPDESARAEPLDAPLARGPLQLAGRRAARVPAGASLAEGLERARAALDAGAALACVELTSETALDAEPATAPAAGRMLGALVPSALATADTCAALAAAGVALLALAADEDEHGDEPPPAQAGAQGGRGDGPPAALLARLRRMWPAPRVLAAELTVARPPAAQAPALARSVAAAGVELLLVRPADPALAIDALVACERARIEGGVATLLDGVRDEDAATTALVAGRADLCRIAPDGGEGRSREAAPASAGAAR